MCVYIYIKLLCPFPSSTHYIGGLKLLLLILRLVEVHQGINNIKSNVTDSHARSERRLTELSSLSVSLVSSGCSVWRAPSLRMVSYKRLNPEDVHFAGAAPSQQPCPAHEDAPVSPHVTHPAPSDLLHSLLFVLVSSCEFESFLQKLCALWIRMFLFNHLLLTCDAALNV